MSKQEFLESYELITPNVRKNTTIVTPETLGQNVFYHIAKTKMKSLVPNVSRKAAPSEDNTVPRVYVAPTLLGCIAGYVLLIYEAFELYPTDKNTPDTWLGGCYIYTIPFEYALKPNSKLLYDAEVSDEHWLISYNRDTITYKPSYVTKMVVIALRSNSFYNGSIVRELDILIEVSESGIHLDKKTYVEGGYYKCTVIYELTYKDDKESYKWKIDNVESISAGEFQSAKKIHAAMLSLPILPPASSKLLQW